MGFNADWIDILIHLITIIVAIAIVTVLCYIFYPLFIVAFCVVGIVYLVQKTL